MTQLRTSGPPPAAVDHLRAIVEHHVWATLDLLDRCQALTPEQLELTTPGTFGSIAATLTHIVRSDRGYQRRFFGEEAPPRPDGPLPVATLRAEMAQQAARWRELLERADELDASVPSQPDEEPPYPAIPQAASLLILQAVHHGEEHRTNVRSVLAAHGLESPEQSGWEFYRTLHLAAHPQEAPPV